MTSKNKTKYVTFRLPNEIMENLNANAERNTRSLSA